MNSVEEIRRQLAAFEASRAGLVARRAEVDETRKANVLAAAGGDADAKRITDESRAEAKRLDSEITDLDEAVAIARANLERAETEAEARARNAEHKRKLDAWRNGLFVREKAIKRAEIAARELLSAFEDIQAVEGELTAVHRDIRPRTNGGLAPMHRPYSVDDSVHRWIACANAIGLCRYLRRLDLGAPNSSSLGSFSDEDAKAVARVDVADKPADANWTWTPEPPPNRGDGFGKKEAA